MVFLGKLPEYALFGLPYNYFRLKNTRFLAIFDQVTTATTSTSVDFLFDHHIDSLLETFTLNHYLFS